MEAAYDKSNSNSAFENDSSLFKFSNMDSGLTITSDIPVLNDTDELQAISPIPVKNSYNDSNDTHIVEESSADVVDNHQRFVDDFGPETDVDGLEDINAAKSPIEFQKTDSITEYDLTNGVKPFSLENKIIQQLSEQNGDFLTDSNPFKNDHFDQYNDENVLDSQLLDQQIKIDSDESAAMVVDNKIIDALESLGITNGEKEKHETEDEKHENDLIDDTIKSPDFPDLTEKVDYSHEKHVFSPDTSAVHDEDFMQHTDNNFDQTSYQEATPQPEQAYTPVLADTGCVEGSVGEESEEEEDEWNYIKGDKKPEDHSEVTEAVEENHNPSETNPVETPQQEEEESSEIPVEAAPAVSASPEPETHLLDVEPVEALVEDDQPIETTETIDEIEEAQPSESTDITEPEVVKEQEFEEQQKSEAVLIKEEPVATEEAAVPNLDSFNDSTSPVPNEEIVDQQTVAEEQTVESDSHLLMEETPRPESVQEQEEEPTGVEIPEEQLEQEHEQGVTELPEVKQEEASIEQQETEPEEVKADQPEEEQEDTATVESERPNSLSFEMASKLNPEAKEFVPTGSPSRSGPTSPVSEVPTMVQNSLLLLDDDTVIAQSPKKCTTTMDNIDVPAEDDFQHEMDNRPHELEKSSEYINGNSEGTVRSHSPVSEPSYQELNLKEAMQADEKLECEYNDEKQTAAEDSSSEVLNEKNLLNVLNKEQDPMNMSFYEGRDEALLSSNSDELNKVHMLPDEDEDITEQAVIDVQVETATEVDSAEKQQDNLLEMESMETQEPKAMPQLASEPLCELLAKSPVQEEPSASIFAVASQVVNDVAALVDQMQIETPVTTNGHDFEMESPEEHHQEELLVEEAKPSEDIVKPEESQDILVSLESQNEVKPIEDTLDVDQCVESPHPTAMDDYMNLHTAETEELMSPTVEAVQQEVVAENEFITDESVLNVPTPTPITMEQESPVESPVVHEPVTEEVCVPVVEEIAMVEPVVEKIAEPEITPVVEAVTPVPEPVESTPAIDIETKPVVSEIVPVPSVAKSTTKSAVTTKAAPPKTTTAASKSAKPTTASADKKTTTTAKPLAAKPAATKPAITSKTTTTAAVKKTTTVSSTTAKTAAATKPTPIGRTSTVGATASKPPVEKKAPLAAKKPTTAVNGDVKPASTTTARKPLTSAVKSTTAKSTTTSSSTTTAARPASASARSTATATKPATAAAKPTPSAPARPSSASTRTTSTVSASAAKPRAVPSTASKTSSTTTVTSKTSQVSSAATKRVSSVGTAASKTATTTSTKTTTTTVKSSSATSRTSTVPKPSSTPATGLRKTSTTPGKKPISSPAAKAGVKPTAGKTVPTKVTIPEKIAPVEETTANIPLLDLDKQLKDDNNQLITKNGIDSQMMVIDSAAD